MTDPVRWSQTPGLPEELARALDAGRAIEPPQGAQQQVLQGVLGAVGVGVAAAAISAGVAKAATNAGSIAAAGSAGTTSVTGATGVMGLTSVKLAALALGSVGVLSATVALQPARHATRPAVTAHAHAHEHVNTRARVPAQLAAEPVLPTQPALVLPLEPSPLPAAEPAPRAHATASEQPARPAPMPSAIPTAAEPQPVPKPAALSESQLVLEARARFRAGDSAAALASLDAADRAGARGVLSQERALLRIRILQRLGWIDEARTKAALFVASHPDSPYAAELRALAAGTGAWPVRVEDHPVYVTPQ